MNLSESRFIIHRDYQNHTFISGNKLYKLEPAIEYALRNKVKTILSFGGPFSNHLHALAYTCRKHNLESVGLIRGELHSTLSPTLIDCQQWGMKLHPFPRLKYREYQDRLAQLPATPENLQNSYKEILPFIGNPLKTMVLPEGGSNVKAINAIANAYAPLFDTTKYSGVTHAICPTGTGATVAGLCIAAAPKGVKVIGIQAVAEGDATKNRIKNWLGRWPKNLSIIPGHLGGFAKTNSDLNRFIAEFESQYNVPLEPVYNAKCLYKLSTMLAENQFSSSDKVLVIHTGGLQGNRGFT